MAACLLALTLAGAALAPSLRFDFTPQAEAFAAGLDGVVSTRSYVGVLRQVYAGLTGQDPAAVVLGGNAPGGQTRLALAGQIARRTANLVHPEMFLSADGRRARILLRVRDVGSRKMLEMIDVLERRLGEIFQPGRGVRARVTGDCYVHERAAHADADGVERAVRGPYPEHHSTVMPMPPLHRRRRVGMPASWSSMTAPARM